VGSGDVDLERVESRSRETDMGASFGGVDFSAAEPGEAGSA
jgi:hypothetical protein